MNLMTKLLPTPSDHLKIALFSAILHFVFHIFYNTRVACSNNLAAEYIAVALTLSQNRCNSARKNVRSKWRVDFFLWWKSPQNWNIGIWISPAISHVNSVLNNVLHPLKSWIFSPFFRQKHVGQQSILSLFHVNFGETFTGGKNCFVTHSVHSF